MAEPTGSKGAGKRGREDEEEDDDGVDERYTKLRLPYVMKKIPLTPTVLEHMRQMKNFRPIRPGQVTTLYGLLVQGVAFYGPFALNKVTDARTKEGFYYIIIDGNHRVQAFTKYFAERPNAVVEACIHTFSNLTEEEMVKVYNAYAGVVQQRESDKVWANQDLIPVIGMMKREFPAPVMLKGGGSGGNKGSFNFLPIAKAYLGRANETAWSAGARDIVEELKKLAREDYIGMRDFAEVIVEVFGKPMPGNVYVRATAMAALAKVYFINVSRLGKAEVVRRLKEKVLQDPTVMNEIVMNKGLGNVRFVTKTIVDAANKGYSAGNRLFVTPGQFTEEIERQNGAQKNAEAKAG